MFTTTVLWIGPGGTTAQAVRDVVASTKACRFEGTAGIEAARSRLLRGDVSLALAYLDHPNNVQQVADLLGGIANAGIPVPTVVVSENSEPEVTLTALRLGAADCLTRPLDLSRLAFLVDILTVRARCEPTVSSRSPVSDSEKPQVGSPGFLFRGPELGNLAPQLRKVALSDSTVCLTGATGTGKTHLARVIHEWSPRRTKPFLVIECGTLSPSLFASELFGHVRGAFTGADHDREGRLAEAQEGTVLLDEIDSIPWETQSKLLRAVEDRVFEPVGSGKTRRLRARLIAATNRPLDEEVAARRFRQDLYYRLNVVSFSLPRLRDCRELIRPLAQQFLADCCSRNHQRTPAVAESALRALEGYDWPGNARELRNVIERLVVLHSGQTIEASDLPEQIGGGDVARDRAIQRPLCGVRNRLEQARRGAERDRLVAALQRNRNNRTHAASELGISRVTLYKKLHRYGLI
jgi:two-component system response regulator AtoC